MGEPLQWGSNGLKNNGTFANNNGGVININRTITSALENSGTFDNAGTINIGNIVSREPMVFSIQVPLTI
ncbi:MAG: hypothetical protein IPI42_06660 [Saprospiraceae bacterium]|nr:hypothetical protein [Candidatus Parvibacillus calidus]